MTVKELIAKLDLLCQGDEKVLVSAPRNSAGPDPVYGEVIDAWEMFTKDESSDKLERGVVIITQKEED